MPLRDVTHVVFDRGNGPFNEAAALEAYHLIAKMDDTEANEFIFHVVNEVVENTITENRDLIQKHLDRTIAKALVYTDLDAVAAGLNADEREEVKKELLSAVSKASEAEENAWKHRDKSGRFASFDHPVPHGALSTEAGKALNIPEHPTDWANMDEKHRAAYRAQYLGIVRALDERGGFDGNNDVRLHYDNGDSKPILAANPRQVAGAINPHKGENVEKVTIRPYKPTIGNHVADLSGSLGTGMQTMAGPGANAPKSTPSGFVDQWYSASPTSNQQMYNRIGAGSQLLEQVGAGSPKLQAAAKFGGLVGQHGNQAENVFGPPVRRMAYRYRGTERKPDRDLVQAYGDAVNRSKQGGAQPNRRQGEDLNAYMERAKQTHAERTPTWAERRAGREEIVNWLQARTPSRALSNLQLASGHTPPSEGVLLNADGQIVTTAVGTADDWYLPFNLKHLQALKGGEYVRTRTTGGLTTEDIYTGLMTGARRVTVVSHSGVYSVEFDPELRGGRRNNDKALRMSQRYGELLDAVQSGKVERQGLSVEAQAEIRNEVAAVYGDPAHGGDPETFKQAYQALVEERRKNPYQIDAKIAALDLQRSQAEKDAVLQPGEDRELTAAERGRALSPQERADFDRERIGLLSQREYFFKLNGLGYRAAQDALKEQFPYYIQAADTTISVNHVPLGGNDRGYVEPGALRPTAARANLFGGAVDHTGNRRPGAEGHSARTAGRAVPIVDRYRNPGDHGAAAAPSGDEPEGPSGSGGSGMPAAKDSQEKIKADAARNKALREAAIEVHAGHNAQPWLPKDEKGKREPGHEELWKYMDREPDDFAQDMRVQGAPEKFLRKVRDTAKRDPNFKYPGKEKAEAALGKESGGAWDYKKATANPGKLYEFPNATTEEKLAAPKAPLALSEGTAGKADKKDLDAEVKLYAAIADAKIDYPGEGPERLGLINDALKEQGLQPETDSGKVLVNNLIKDDKQLERQTKLIQMNRAVAYSGGSVAQGAEDYLKSLPSAGERRHPSGREFTEKEKAQGYYHDNGKDVEI